MADFTSAAPVSVRYTHFLLYLGLVFIFSLAAHGQVAWRSFGKLQHARHLHCALPIGPERILVMGGWANSENSGAGNVLAECEIIDLENNRVFGTGALNTARAEFTALLTRDSNVVVIGGIYLDNRLDPLPATASVELYNRTSGKWTHIGNLIQARFGHSAVFIDDTRILVAGGLSDPSTNLASAEIFDISSGVSTAIEALPVALNGGVAARTSSGEILVLGGRSGGGNSSRPREILRYDAGADTWNAIGNLDAGLYAPELITLWDGRLALSGGSLRETAMHDFSAQVLLAENEQFRHIGDLQLPRILHSFVQWGPDSLLVLGGWNEAGTAETSCEFVHDTGTPVWAVEPGPDMHYYRRYFCAVSMPVRNAATYVHGRIVAIGGFRRDTSRNAATIEILQQASIPLAPVVHSFNRQCSSYSFTVSIAGGNFVEIQLIDSLGNLSSNESEWNLSEDSVRVRLSLRDPWQPDYFTIRILSSDGSEQVLRDSVTNRMETPPDILPANLDLCEGESVELYTSLSYSSYRWFRVGTPGFSANATYSVHNSGSYYLGVLDENGCVGYSDTVTVSVSGIPEAPFLAPQVPNGQLCAGDTVWLDGGANHVRYRWFRNQDSLSAGNNRMLPVVASGWYRIEVADGPGCFRSSDSVYIEFIPEVFALEGISDGRFVMPCTNATSLLCVDILLHNIDSQPHVLNRGDFEFAANVYFSLPEHQFAPPRTLMPGESTTLTVCYAPRSLGRAGDELRISANCRNTRIRFICEGMVPNEYSDTTNCDIPILLSTRGFETVAIGGLIVSPNPGTDLVRLELLERVGNRSTALPYRIVDQLGTCVAQGLLNLQPDAVNFDTGWQILATELDVHSFRRGCYWLAIMRANGEIARHPLIIVR